MRRTLIVGIVSVILYLSVLATTANSQGVIQTPYRDGVTIVESTGETTFHSSIAFDTTHNVNDWLSGIPADDNNKWYILIFCDQSIKSAEILNLFYTNSYLMELRNWSHFNVHYVNNPGQSRRFKQYQIKKYPSIRVITPPSSPLYKYRYVYWKNDWEENDSADELARSIVSAVRQFVRDKDNYRRNPEK